MPLEHELEYERGRSDAAKLYEAHLKDGAQQRIELIRERESLRQRLAKAEKVVEAAKRRRDAEIEAAKYKGKPQWADAMRHYATVVKAENAALADFDAAGEKGENDCIICANPSSQYGASETLGGRRIHRMLNVADQWVGCKKP